MCTYIQDAIAMHIIFLYIVHKQFLGIAIEMLMDLFKRLAPP